MEYQEIDGPDGLRIRVPTSDDYRTCSECGGDCEPEPTGSDGHGVRFLFVCPTHGVQSIVDPFADLR